MNIYTPQFRYDVIDFYFIFQFSQMYALKTNIMCRKNIHPRSFSKSLFFFDRTTFDTCGSLFPMNQILEENQSDLKLQMSINI